MATLYMFAIACSIAQAVLWKYMSSEISDLRNFWLHAMYTCTE